MFLSYGDIIITHRYPKPNVHNHSLSEKKDQIKKYYRIMKKIKIENNNSSLVADYFPGTASLFFLSLYFSPFFSLLFFFVETKSDEKYFSEFFELCSNPAIHRGN